MNGLVEDLALERRCPYCDAPPGYWCVTVSYRRASWLHAERVEDLRMAYAQGWMDGENDVRKGLVS